MIIFTLFDIIRKSKHMHGYKFEKSLWSFLLLRKSKQ